jgi:hypothetical protein
VRWHFTFHPQSGSGTFRLLLRMRVHSHTWDRTSTSPPFSVNTPLNLRPRTRQCSRRNKLQLCSFTSPLSNVLSSAPCRSGTSSSSTLRAQSRNRHPISLPHPPSPPVYRPKRISPTTLFDRTNLPITTFNPLPSPPSHTSRRHLISNHKRIIPHYPPPPRFRRSNG